MVVYKCTRCGATQSTNSACHSCAWNDSMMAMIESNRKLNADLNMAFYADGGCCGCNTKRRRIMCIVITVVCLIISGILAIIDVNANGNTCISLLILGGLFLLAGIFCPDGCCGQYRKNRPNNQNGQYSSV